MNIGSDVLTLRAYPRTSIKIKGVDRSPDYRFFKLNEINETYVQVLLDKTLNDLVDRDVPQNLLKFKIECSSREGQSEEVSHNNECKSITTNDLDCSTVFRHRS